MTFDSQIYFVHTAAMDIDQFASKNNIGSERARQLCKSGRVVGARKIGEGRGGMWTVPENAVVLPANSKVGGGNTNVGVDAGNILQSLSFNYGWSNKNISNESLIRNVLKRGLFEDVCRICACFGFDRVASFLPEIEDEVLHKMTARSLNNIFTATTRVD